MDERQKAMSFGTVRPTTATMFRQLQEKLANREPYEMGGWLNETKEAENGFLDLFDKMKSPSSSFFNGSGVSISVGSGVAGANTALSEVNTTLDNMDGSVDRADSKNDTQHAKSLAIDLNDLMDVVKTAADRARSAWEEDTTQTKTDYETALSRVNEAIATASGYVDQIWGIHKDTNYESEALRKELSSLNSALDSARSAKRALDSSLNGSVDVTA